MDVKQVSMVIMWFLGSATEAVFLCCSPGICLYSPVELQLGLMNLWCGQLIYIRLILTISFPTEEGTQIWLIFQGKNSYCNKWVYVCVILIRIASLHWVTNSYFVIKLEMLVSQSQNHCWSFQNNKQWQTRKSARFR